MTAREEMGALFKPLEDALYQATTDIIVEAYLARCFIETKWTEQVDAATAAAAQHVEEIE